MTKLTLMIINFLLFHISWLSNALGAAHGMTWLGPAVVGISLTIHFFLMEHRWLELRTILLITAIGFTVDTVIYLSGIYGFHSGHVFINALPPIWLLSQWLIFGSLFRLCLDWLNGRWLLSGLLGATAGPTSYYAAVSLNALQFPANDLMTMALLAVPWALMLPTFVWIAHMDEKDEGTVLGESIETNM